jgi:ornithine cyclodeaminase
MHFADKDQVHALLPYPLLIEWLGDCLAGPMPESKILFSDEPEGGSNQFVTLVGWRKGDLIAVKMVGVFAGNMTLDPPQASVQGLVCAFSGKTGTPVLVADGEAMTFRKTAADSGLGAKLLARADARTLLVVGAGGLAPHVVEAHRAARPSIDVVRIWNRTAARAEALAASLRGQGLDAEAVEDLDGAVPHADIISCVTMSETPLVRGALLKPGAHLDLVGAYLPSMRECDEDAIARASVFVNSRRGIENAGELCHAVASGRFRWQDIRAEAAEICGRTHGGRTSDDEITVYKNIGGGQFDLFTAACLLARFDEPTSSP